MNRRTFIKTLPPLAVSPMLGSNKPHSDEPATNVLFLMADDLNLALGCYHHPAAFTPNIDRLARRGLRFLNAFCPYPLCGPSRSSLMTGVRPEQLGMANNEVAWRDLRPRLKTLPQIARERGYYTERVGKIMHHGISANNPVDFRAEGFGLPHTHTDPESWDEEWGGSPRLHEFNAKGPEQLIDGRPLGGTSLHSIRASQIEALPDYAIAERAVSFLASEKAQRAPFFLGVGFHKPHVPLCAPERWWQVYEGLEVDPLFPPTASRPCASLPVGTLKSERFHRGADEAQRRHLYRGYLACVSFMDEQVGKVLDALDKSGLSERTLVVFVSDHGYHIGEQGQWDKMMLLDPSLRIPMLIAGPDIPEGETSDSIVESHDLFPTLLSYLGWRNPQETDGNDLLASFHRAGTRGAADECAFSWLDAGLRRGWSMRTRTYRYGLTSYDNANPEPYLFDVVADPYESTNLADRAEMESVQSELEHRLREHFAQSAPVS